MVGRRLNSPPTRWTVSASWFTEYAASNWLKTRYSPAFGGFSTAIRSDCMESSRAMYPRVCPPAPYTVRGTPRIASTTNRLRAVPQTSSKSNRVRSESSEISGVRIP